MQRTLELLLRRRALLRRRRGELLLQRRAELLLLNVHFTLVAYTDFLTLKNNYQVFLQVFAYFK